ncbi:hypothetical protein [Microbacterium sp.]|uniref:hypothetical protein n=1 Tax=Microbacterium sp. TaxID=51671 RepID=UPI003F952399
MADYFTVPALACIAFRASSMICRPLSVVIGAGTIGLLILAALRHAAVGSS